MLIRLIFLEHCALKVLYCDFHNNRYIKRFWNLNKIIEKRNLTLRWGMPERTIFSDQWLNDISVMNQISRILDSSHWLNASQSGQFILYRPPSHIWIRNIQFQLRQDNNNSNFRLRLKFKILFRLGILLFSIRFRFQNLFRYRILWKPQYKTFNQQCSGNWSLINILSNNILGTTYHNKILAA